MNAITGPSLTNAHEAASGAPSPAFASHGRTLGTARVNFAAFETLSGIPQVDFPLNLKIATAAGHRMSSILWEVVTLRLGPGSLTPNEYFYYRLWEPRLTDQARLGFVGKQAQHPMHIACNNTGWYAAAADKLLFHTLMVGAGLPVPTLLAVSDASRGLPHVPALRDRQEITAFLRRPTSYPLFAKPIDGKYSLAVLSADTYDRAADLVLMQDGEARSPEILADQLAERKAGFVLQRRMDSHPWLAKMFGPRLWSVRLIVLVTSAGPVIHRAVVKIATGNNPADNFWRQGNMIGAVDLKRGQIDRVVQGTGAEMIVNARHPDTLRPIVGIPLPDWDALTVLVKEASKLLPGIRTQSWDIALTDQGPIPLEVNFGGDLNLSQLASGAGVLDDAYREHLQACGYRLKRGNSAPAR